MDPIAAARGKVESEAGMEHGEGEREREREARQRDIGQGRAEVCKQKWEMVFEYPPLKTVRCPSLNSLLETLGNCLDVIQEP